MGRKRIHPIGPKMPNGVHRVHPTLMRSKSLVVRMTEDEWQQLNVAAKYSGKSLSLMARSLMVQSL